MTDKPQQPSKPEAPQAPTPEPAPASITPQQPPPQPLPITPQLLAQLLGGQRVGGMGMMPNLGQPIPMGGSPGNPMLLAAQVVQQQMQHWQGPYPPPEAVERYEKILPGTFDRMIKMAEQLQSAQIEEAKEIRKMTHADQKRGNYLGFLTAVGAMVGGLVCLKLDSPWLGAVFLSVPVMGVAKALVESSLTSRQSADLPAISQHETPAPQPEAPTQA